MTEPPTVDIHVDNRLTADIVYRSSGYCLSSTFLENDQRPCRTKHPSTMAPLAPGGWFWIASQKAVDQPAGYENKTVPRAGGRYHSVPRDALRAVPVTDYSTATRSATESSHRDTLQYERSRVPYTLPWAFVDLFH